MARALDDGAVWAFDLGAVNAYLVDDGTVTLVDAGTPGSADDLRAELADAGYDAAAVDRVLLTHFDLDHVGGLAPLAVDAPVYAAEPDASLLEGTERPPLSKLKGLFQRAVDPFLTRPDVDVDRVADGDTVGEFRAYHTPGHTPGHVAYHHADLGVALLGDLVQGDDGRLDTSPWFFAYDADRNDRSVRALADRGLSFDVACVGHGDPLADDGDAALSALADR